MARKKRSTKPVIRHDNQQDIVPNDSRNNQNTPIEEGLLGPEDYFVIGGTADA